MLERRFVVALAVVLCTLAVPLAAEEPIFRDLTLKSLQDLPSRGGAWFVPLTVPSRTFPRLSDVLGNVATLGESMSNRNRTMTFRLTARDNRAGGGGVNYAATTVQVVTAAGPFAVTQPNTAVTWAGGSAQTVTWNVASTTAAPVSCANVAIALSTDGGATFSDLVASTPNDGTQSVTLPATPDQPGAHPRHLCGQHLLRHLERQLHDHVAGPAGAAASTLRQFPPSGAQFLRRYHNQVVVPDPEEARVVLCGCAAASRNAAKGLGGQEETSLQGGG